MTKGNLANVKNNKVNTVNGSGLKPATRSAQERQYRV